MYSDPAPEDYTGVPENHSWKIKAAIPGSQQINGVYKRALKDANGPEDNFTPNVKVV
ncbi:protease inhibitor I42 family protein [Methanosarcina sp. WWM596]|uniref:protease inhibitor I42 family protein n=1 Tax=Methanosarcina sp. WWM596 TaxID=1434103 RepID=UPI00350F64B4